MKKIIPVMAILGSVFMLFTAFSSISKTNGAVSKEVQWKTWTEAINSNRETPKKILVFMRTTWCGWCKRMEADVFDQKEIASYLNENFHCVMFDAEMKEEIEYQGTLFKHNPNEGRRGIHELANALFQENSKSYPTLIFLNESEEIITSVAGYQTVEETSVILKYISEEKYKSMPYDDFKTSLEE